jgi:hypothetical protein
LPISFDQVSGEFSIKYDSKRQNPFCSEMYLDILSDRTCDYRKENTAKCYDRDRTSIERHMFEDKEYHRDQNSYLRKSRSNQGPTQLIHPPENLQGKLLDASEHETC